jgi:hypothetical protein
MTSETAERLSEYFAPHEARLRVLLGDGPSATD